MPALFFNLYQIARFSVQKKKKKKRADQKTVFIWLCIWPLAALMGAVCCFSANSHGSLYERLLAMQHGKESSISDVCVEGTVSKIEEKSTLWIYLENASIKCRVTDGESTDAEVTTEMSAAGEGVIVQLTGSRRPLAGSRIALTGELSLFSAASNPGEFDSRSYYHNMGYDFCLSAQEWEQKGEKYDRIAERLWQLREAAKEKLAQLCPQKDYGIYCAVLLGDKSDLDADQKKLFQDQGIAHILSVSGLHISAIGMLLFGIFMKLTGSFAFSGAMGSILVLFYTSFTGNAVSTIRAAIMYLIAAAGRQRGRIYDMPTAVAAAALCILFFQPLAIFQASMQLSFGAVLGISLAGDVFKRLPKKVSHRESGFFAVMGLSIVMLPVMLYHFYQYPLYSLLINQLILPFAGILMAAPAAALGASLIGPSFSSALLFPGHLVILFYDFLCRFFEKLPLSVQYPGRPSAWRIIVYFALLGVIGISGRILNHKRKEMAQANSGAQKKRQKYLLHLFAVLLASGYYGFGCLFLHADAFPDLSITMLDVGQGDCVFLKLPDGTAILSDGGSSSRQNVETYVLEPFLWSNGISRLDYVFVSHADSDHTNAVFDLMEEYPDMIGTLMLPESDSAQKQFSDLLALADKNNIPVNWVSKGDVLRSAAVPDLSFEILWPEKNAFFEDTNALSLVWRLSYGNFSMLFTGDLPKEQETSLTGLEASTVLKVAHHGSNYSTTSEFLQLVQPKLAVISCSANNRYNHPGADTLSRLQAQNTQILITKDCGAITITADKTHIQAETFLENNN